MYTQTYIVISWVLRYEVSQDRMKSHTWLVLCTQKITTKSPSVYNGSLNCKLPTADICLWSLPCLVLPAPQPKQFSELYFRRWSRLVPPPRKHNPEESLRRDSVSPWETSQKTSWSVGFRSQACCPAQQFFWFVARSPCPAFYRLHQGTSSYNALERFFPFPKSLLIDLEQSCNKESSKILEKLCDYYYIGTKKQCLHW